MRESKNEKAEIAAAKERLARFVKTASQCMDHYDPERMRRVKEGRENEPRGVSWSELARTLWRRS